MTAEENIEDQMQKEIEKQSWCPVYDIEYFHITEHPIPDLRTEGGWKVLGQVGACRGVGASLSIVAD